MTPFEKHIEILQRVNNAQTDEEHDREYWRLCGFRDALEIFSHTQLMDCDWFYMNQGIDRPMCGGIFPDWKSVKTTQNDAINEAVEGNVAFTLIKDVNGNDFKDSFTINHNLFRW